MHEASGASCDVEWLDKDLTNEFRVAGNTKGLGFVTFASSALRNT